MATTSRTALIDTGRQASTRYDWTEAFEALQAADAQGALDPEDLETLAEAAWWMGRLDDCIEARERAYASYLDRDLPRRAAAVALELVENSADRGDRSVAAGWLQRSSRLLETEPEGVEHGYLAESLAVRAWVASRFDEAHEQASRALGIGGRNRDRDLQALALSMQGFIRIDEGHVSEGRSLMEEATAAAVGGELGPRATAMVFCRMIAACHALADYGGAGEWAKAARRWCERQAIHGFPGVCRVDSAEVLRLRGAWLEAQDELHLATEELIGFNVQAAGAAFNQIGMIRLLEGDDEGAERHFRRAQELQGWESEPGMGLLRLRRGDVAAARSGLDRSLAEDSERSWHAQLLPTAVEVRLVAGDVEAARNAAEELANIAEIFGSAAMKAAAAEAAGKVALAEANDATATRELRRALRLWQEIDLPYEAARTREALGRALRTQGDEEAAKVEIETARATFERLGARPDVEICDALLRADLGAAASIVARTFLFTDVVGSTPLLEAIGDEAWGDLRRWHDETLRACFAEHSGEEIDHAGDGFFVAFPDQRSAIESAIDIQRRLAGHRREHGFAPQIRIGLHAGEAIRSNDGYGGKGVHVAARIGALATAGEIIASTAAIVGLHGFTMSDRRDARLKGVREPVEVVSIAWR